MRERLGHRHGTDLCVVLVVVIVVCVLNMKVSQASRRFSGRVVSGEREHEPPVPALTSYACRVHETNASEYNT
jgi:hypothetical protein